MSRLTTIPDLWLNLSPNLDMVFDIHLPEFNEWDMSWNALNQLVLLTRRAETASFQAVSWRPIPFRVGAAAVAGDIRSKRMGILTGFNIKPSESKDINIHAEQMALEKMRRTGLSKVYALAVWGEPQPDQQSGIVSPTLHPCGLCREMLTEMDEVTDQTIIASGNVDFSICEVYCREEINAYHTNDVLHRPQLDRINLADSVLDNRSYDEALGFLLLQQWVKRNPEAPYSRQLLGWFERGQPTGR